MAGGGDVGHYVIYGRVPVIFIDSAPAPTIVVLFSLLFVITFIYATLRDRRLENQLQLQDP